MNPFTRYLQHRRLLKEAASLDRNAKRLSRMLLAGGDQAALLRAANEAGVPMAGMWGPATMEMARAQKIQEYRAKARMLRSLAKAAELRKEADGL